MEDNLRNFLMALPVALIAGSAWAQDSATVTDNCANHLNTSPNPTVGALLNCLAEMQRTIDRLEAAASAPPALSPSNIAAIAQELKNNHPEAIKGSPGDPGQPGSDAQFPSGAVIAFDGGEHEKTGNRKLQVGCPPGWVRFEQADGRFILGSDSYPGFEVGNGPTYRLRSEDGASSITLTARQMVPHSHSIDMFAGDRFDTTGGATPQGGDYNSSFIRSGAGSTNSFGGRNGNSEPIDIMPPYIALYFCKKG